MKSQIDLTHYRGLQKYGFIVKRISVATMQNATNEQILIFVLPYLNTD
jgi:hypothetical protein